MNLNGFAIGILAAFLFNTMRRINRIEEKLEEMQSSEDTPTEVEQ